MMPDCMMLDCLSEHFSRVYGWQRHRNGADRSQNNGK
jgi:hypothetical protein